MIISKQLHQATGSECCKTCFYHKTSSKTDNDWGMCLMPKYDGFPVTKNTETCNSYRQKDLWQNE